jgi:translation elongation factor EF-Tu-like GTPase
MGNRVMRNVDDFRATIFFVPTDAGGRSTPVFSGYRPPLFFPSDPAYEHDAVITLEGRDRVSPGEESVVRIRFLAPDCPHQHLLKPDAPFEVREGARVVGRGKILQVLRRRETIQA